MERLQEYADRFGDILFVVLIFGAGYGLGLIS